MQNTKFFQVLMINAALYDFNMILLRIKNCTLSTAVLRNKHQVTIRKS